MNYISKDATATLFNLIQRAGNKSHKKFTAKGRKPLHYQFDGAFASENGPAGFVSLSYLSDINGDLIRIPEIQFIIWPYPHYKKGIRALAAYYHHQYEGISEASINVTASGKLIVNKEMQARHTYLANEWLAQIKEWY